MLIGVTSWDIAVAALLALTPMERWSAASRGNSDFVSEYGTVLLAGLVLILLVLLLWQVSLRRSRENAAVREEMFSDRSMERGLSARERQILTAVTARSGLRRNYEIFESADAFYRGAEKLLGECAANRTPAEISALREEVRRLCEKLGFQSLEAKARGRASDGPSTRSIRVGKMLDLVRRQDPHGPHVQAEVIRNDDLELAVELYNSVATRPGEVWRVRYCLGMSIWEFDTSVVNCDQTRLVLSHSGAIRFVNRRRFPRAAVSAPALVARFPFASHIAASTVGASNRNASMEIAPTFVSGVLTELAGPGAQIMAPLGVREGERILVVVQLAEKAGRDAPNATQGHVVVQHIGEVRHVRDAGGQSVIALELVGLTDAEIDELTRLKTANAVSDDGHDEQAAAYEGANARTLASVGSRAGREA
jgi:hypothetical protein